MMSLSGLTGVTSFRLFGNSYGFGSVIDLVLKANNTLRDRGIIDHGQSIDFRQSLSGYILLLTSLTGNRIDTWTPFGPTGSDSTFSFTRRFLQIKKMDYLFNPFFNVQLQFYPSKKNHIDGIFIKPMIHDLDTISLNRVNPLSSGQVSNLQLLSVTSSISGSLIYQIAKNNDLRFFLKDVSSLILILPKRQTLILISNITQLLDQFNTRTIGTKLFIMLLYGYDTGTSTFRFKRRTDDAVGTDLTDGVLNMLIKLKLRLTRKIVKSTDNLVKISFNAVQDLYANSPSLDNIDQYNNLKNLFNFVDYFIYPKRLDNRNFIFKKDLLLKLYTFPVTKDGILLSIFGWSGFDVLAQLLFLWTLNILDLSSGDIIKFQFKFRNLLS